MSSTLQIEGSYIAWLVGNDLMWLMDGRAIGPNGNIESRVVSEEPMAMVLDLGISNSWVWIDWSNLVFPAVMRVDYVRWYQEKGRRSVGCDLKGWETTAYIRDRAVAYTNANLTLWNETGYEWPENRLTSDC